MTWPAYKAAEAKYLHIKYPMTADSVKTHLLSFETTLINDVIPALKKLTSYADQIEEWEDEKEENQEEEEDNKVDEDDEDDKDYEDNMTEDDSDGDEMSGDVTIEEDDDSQERNSNSRKQCASCTYKSI